MSATWKVEIKNENNKEIKNYEFSDVGTYNLETPNLDEFSCSIIVNDPVTINEGQGQSKAQATSIGCLSKSGIILTRKVCHLNPLKSESEIPLAVFVGDDDKHGKKANKKNKLPDSYNIILSCE
jgi:hypothetical protein